MPTRWEKVEADNGASFEAYVVEPEKPSEQAIVVLQEIFGVNEALRDVATLFAHRGYLAVVPDLFWRIQPHIDLDYDKDSVKQAFSLLQQFSERSAVADIAATVRQIRKFSPKVKFIHLIGFCLGGKLAVLSAGDRNVTSVISLYGVGIEKDLDALAQANCPMQLHFGGLDKFVPSPAVAAVEQEAKGLDIEVFIYPEANHGFFAPKRQSYHQPSADLAWSRCLAVMQRAMSNSPKQSMEPSSAGG